VLAALKWTNLALNAVEIKHGDGAPFELAAPWREPEGLKLRAHAAGKRGAVRNNKMASRSKAVSDAAFFVLSS
jgi:hypothetical protein